MKKISEFIEKSNVQIEEIDLTDEIGQTVVSLLDISLGIGESACMGYCKHKKYIIGGANFKDILKYCRDNKIQIIGVCRTIYDAVKLNYITKIEAEHIWQEMLRKKRILPTKTYEEVKEAFDNNDGYITVNKRLY